MHFDIGVLYIRNVRNLGPSRLKVGVGDALLKGLYHLDGRFRPRGLSSVDGSIKGLVRARQTLLRSRTSDNVPLDPRGARECYGGAVRGHQRGKVCDVQVLIVSLLGLAFATTFTTLALGLAVLTLVLLVGGMLLLVRPLLLIPVRVTALVFNRRDLVGIVSLPSPVEPWVQWSNKLAREMYMKRVLSRLSLKYPDSPMDS